LNSYKDTIYIDNIDTMPPKKTTGSKSKAEATNAPVESTVRKVKQISQLDHAKRKSMWVGSKKIQTMGKLSKIGYKNSY
jgi:hypothetical protein